MENNYYTKTEIDLKFDAIQNELRYNRELTQLGFEKINERFERVDERFERINDRFERVNDRMDDLLTKTQLMFSNFREEQSLARVDELERERKIKREFILWSIGTTIALLAVLIPLIIRS
ncbi:hypothetical protein [Streptococcus sp. NLN76]|uniref:hypothetical protein n=1 Tax=Streptococcus sp. NLN76 TaxID=2822800 RepID=UPI0018AB147A|nr:hypothetical protein [Streptococcus sp. NLN76]MBF8969592.1 hypothetical protein [Streptococcus sp. NLN76]